MWLIYALLAALMWGLDYVLSERLLKNKISPLMLMTFESLIPSMIFFIMLLSASFKKQLSLLLTDKTNLIFIILILLTFNLASLFIFLAIREKNATEAGLVEICYPLFSALFSLFLFKEGHLTFGVLVGGVLIFAGVTIITYFG